MAGPIEDAANLSLTAAIGTLENSGFSVSHQEVELNVDFASRTLTGRTAIRIEPSSRDLKFIRLRCRQTEIKAITVEKWPVAAFEFNDPYRRLRARAGYSVYQHHLIHEKLEQDFQRVEPELTIPLPRQLRILPQSPFFAGRDANLAVPLDPSTPRFLDDSGTAYQPFTVYIDYVIKSARDGIHWVGLQGGDQRYPHAYTHNSALFGPQSCFVFPCVDAPSSKHTWRFTFNCPRTVADLAIPAKAPGINGRHRNGKSNGKTSYTSDMELDSESLLESLSEEEKGLDISVVCSGYMEDNDVSQLLSLQFRQI
jgi:transcription initiation factor TFIID subunit 2